MGFLVDAIERVQSGEYKPSPEQIERAEAFAASQLSSLKKNFVDFEKSDEGRAPVTLSSHFFCSRKIAYALLGEDKGAIDIVTRRKFYQGDMMELMVVYLLMLSEIGESVIWPHPETHEQVAVTLDLAGDTIEGHPDVLLNLPGRGNWLVEIKKMSSYGFMLTRKRLNNVKAGNLALREGECCVEDTFGYVSQIRCYQQAMMKDGEPCGASFICVDGDKMEFLEEEIAPWPKHLERVEMSYAAARSSALPESDMISRPSWAETKTVKAAEKYGGGPGGCEEVTATRCKYCTFKQACWPGFQEVEMSGGKKAFRRPLQTKE